MSHHAPGYVNDGFALVQARAQDLVPCICRAARALLLAPGWEQAMSAILADTGTALRASRAYLLRNIGPELPDGSLKFAQAEEWNDPSLGQQSPELGSRRLRVSGEAFSEWAQRYLRGEAVCGMVNNLSPLEQQFLLRPNTQAIAVFPVMAEGRLWGALGFDDSRNRRLWKEPELLCLRGLADVIGAAVERSLASAEYEGSQAA